MTEDKRKMTEELKQKATECWDKRWNNKLADIGKWEHQKALPYDNYIDGFSDGYLEGLKAKTQWHNLQENPTDLPQCKEDEQIIFYVREWYENVSKYRNHYCLGFYKKAFMNDDVKVFVEKSKGYENEHLPSTVLRWYELPKVSE